MGHWVIGPIHTVLTVPSRQLALTIITFIDDFSKYTTIYLLKNKSDAFEKFQDFLKEVENQFGRK